MGEHDRLDHFVLGDFLPEAFDHQHGLFASGHNQVERALLQVLLRRQHDQPAVHEAHAHRGNWMVKGDWRDAQGGTGTRGGMNVRIILLIAGQHVGHDLDFVGEAFREEGTQRPVGETALSTSRVVGRPSRLRNPPAKRPAAAIRSR